MCKYVRTSFKPSKQKLFVTTYKQSIHMLKLMLCFSQLLNNSTYKMTHLKMDLWKLLKDSLFQTVYMFQIKGGYLESTRSWELKNTSFQA
jgi:hypothetical protein